MGIPRHDYYWVDITRIISNPEANRMPSFYCWVYLPSSWMSADRAESPAGTIGDELAFAIAPSAYRALAHDLVDGLPL